MPLAYKSFGPRRAAARSTGRRRLATILLFACAAGGCATPNQVADSPERGLRQAFISARILARTNQPENVKPIAFLQKENARKLSELVAGGALGAREVLIARFARAEAAIQAAYRERDPAAPVNREVLRQGLEDMEAFIARPDFDYPEWGITPAQALKIAGGTAVLLDDGAKGYSYYRRCADLGQMACRNIEIGRAHV